jgi:hypothetical protein
LAERLGSGDGERKTLLTRQIAFEPLPASVLFALVRGCSLLIWGQKSGAEQVDAQDRHVPLPD